MLYNSYIFILAYLPIVLIGWYVLNRFKAYNTALGWLVLSSLFFYGYFNWSYLPIIIVSVIANYVLSVFIRPDTKHGLNNKVRKVLLILGLSGNIGMLFYYKYFDFFAQNINALFKTNFSMLNLLLPLGISFFTFQQISYIVDSYKGKQSKCSILEYSVFVTYFPQLIAGPIVLHSEVIPQFQNIENRRFNSDNFAKGLCAFSIGLAKKVLVADTFAKAADYGFSHIEGLGTVNALIVMLSYTFQIYFDFSGYCDMATGIGKFFNIDLPMNFNSPYKAVTITDFWKRWHMTMTRFFTTYIYIPLGGSRKGKIRTYINVMIVFLVSGLWHGANWTFILWGGVHGIANVLTRMFKERIDKWHMAFSWLLTFAFVNVTWVIFRADSIASAVRFFKEIIWLNITPLLSDIKSAFILPEFKYILEQIGKGGYTYLLWAVFIVAALWVCLQARNTNERLDDFKPTVVNAGICAFVLVWGIISLSGISTFLYWNF